MKKGINGRLWDEWNQEICLAIDPKYQGRKIFLANQQINPLLNIFPGSAGNWNGVLHVL